MPVKRGDRTTLPYSGPFARAKSRPLRRRRHRRGHRDPGDRRRQAGGAGQPRLAGLSSQGWGSPNRTSPHSLGWAPQSTVWFLVAAHWRLWFWPCTLNWEAGHRFSGSGASWHPLLASVRSEMSCRLCWSAEGASTVARSTANSRRSLVDSARARFCAALSFLGAESMIPGSSRNSRSPANPACAALERLA